MTYKIIGFKANFNSTNQSAVQVQIANSAKTFFCLVKDVYNTDWIKHLSKEDCTYLASLYVSDKENKPEIVREYPRKSSSVSVSVVILAAIYTGIFILSNIAGSKIININSITIPAVLFIFPLTFILDDIITEVYGFKVSRAIIWSALLANLLVVLGAIMVVKFNPSDYWHDQKAFETVFLASPRILVASISAYLIGEFLNSILLAKMKIHTIGRHLWLRSIVSTSVGTALDSVLFCLIAFHGKLPLSLIISMIVTQYLFKIIYAIIAIPAVYKISNFLKKKDNIDVYDFHTKFNPFSVF